MDAVASIAVTFADVVFATVVFHAAILAVDWVDVMPITHCNNDFTIRMYCSGLISRIHLFHPKNLLLFVATS